ncbi:conserved hypothetical protein [Talaromyces stipitatus ATCC 10500]|uniref:protein-histidine N-methyltransferase n=1 Tax=Talaromyces stipitatus (strain ATCC 10500 / CBS 375.48 / QM 6759 / NRRL 1006) TaxID=441959 RepID=B8MDY0_TALSN|nr:uncharacterized protein TSTA_011660 [Talaromyces stipitatus ATCC 10500]EED16057.1 conserved hypothetical protein [Talaromyces stipitatus ATCC 10500]
MASTFRFGFSGDDIDVDIDNDVEVDPGNNVSEKSQAEDVNAPDMFPAVRHALKDWTTNLPSQLSYNTFKVEISNPDHQTINNNEKNSTQTNKTITIARRELFDVRTQLMAEDDDSGFATGHTELIADLEQGDLKPNFYEGGFKTWECSLDLADVLLNSKYIGEGEGEDEGVNVIELGCGTAAPSLMLFAQVLLSSTTDQRQKRRFRFTLADYNSTVLRMVTLCNFLLTWWVNSPSSPRRTSTDGAVNGKDVEEEGELDIDTTLLDTFQADLANRVIELDFISGGWSPEFVRLVLNRGQQFTENVSTLILASETIYSPSSLGVFSETLLELLRSSAGVQQERRNKSTALIAAKKVYFGVGGGVDEFLQVLHQQPLQDEEVVQVQERREITSGGVKRVVLEIGFSKN